MAKYYKLQNMGGGVAAYSVEDVQPANGSDFSLSELQGYVGGYIEIVDLYDGRIMVVNENGLNDELPINPLATATFQELTHGNDIIVGSVVICDAEQVK